jgi:hypothetical protein
MPGSQCAHTHGGFAILFPRALMPHRSLLLPSFMPHTEHSTSHTWSAIVALFVNCITRKRALELLFVARARVQRPRVQPQAQRRTVTLCAVFCPPNLKFELKWVGWVGSAHRAAHGTELEHLSFFPISKS